MRNYIFIFTVVFALLCMGAFPLAAAEWNFYGSSRMTTFSVDDDDGSSSSRSTTWALQGNARIGANVKVNETLTGRFEYGSGPNLRLLYAEWDFGAGKLLVGQSYTPAGTYFYSNQVFGSDNDLLNCGQQYGGRNPMLRFSFNDFKIAFIKPNTGKGPVGLSGSTDVSLPKIEASYNIKANAFFLDISGGYQTYELDSTDIDSFLFALGGGYDFGAAYVRANVYVARNGYAYGLSGLGNASITSDASGSGGINDNDTFGYLGVLGWKLSDALALEAGFGHIEHELDEPGHDADESSTYYLNTTIQLAKGVFIVPEIGFIDYADDCFGNDEGDVTYFGAKWQINF